MSSEIINPSNRPKSSVSSFFILFNNQFIKWKIFSFLSHDLDVTIRADYAKNNELFSNFSNIKLRLVKGHSVRSLIMDNNSHLNIRSLDIVIENEATPFKYLPKSVETLCLVFQCEPFPLNKGFLGNSISTLSLSGRYDEVCLNLPPSIRKLMLNGRVALPPSLPKYLQHLELDGGFSEKITKEYQFPQTLEYIKFGSNYSHSIYHCTLSHIKTVVFVRKYINLALPTGEMTYFCPISYLPPPVSDLVCLKYDDRDTIVPLTHLPTPLPQNLRYLDLGDVFNDTLDDLHLPDNLTTLKLGNEFNQCINHLPAQLRHLTFGQCFNSTINQPLPRQLEKLEFGVDFDRPITSVLPDTLLELKFGRRFNQKLEIGDLPSQLQVLILDDKYCWPIEPRVLPHSLKRLKLGSKISEPFEFNVIPHGVISLSFGGIEGFYLLPGVLPCSLRYLQMDIGAIQTKTICLPNGIKKLSYQFPQGNLRFYAKDDRRLLKNRKDFNFFSSQ
ncbi:hypothetical protein CYY_008335 [Polysphondylium violaceum]|uniref:FNIP repeat-containing protein n=1 Tax=Polysphondylium violaceum TaxID=133409 RepID=A0A8J4UXD8_9MYCE|nr:hypothetical protein CYY_008335 [Polysphondylium violaceum]